MQYIVRRAFQGSPHQFVVAKFNPGKSEPQDVYHVVYTDDDRHCDCPAYKPHCKHLDMIKQWLALNEKEPGNGWEFNEDTGQWEWADIFSKLEGLKELLEELN